MQCTLGFVNPPNDQVPDHPSDVDSAVERLTDGTDGAEPTTAGILVWAYVAGRQLDAWLADRTRDEDTDVARDARRLEDELRALGYIQSVEAPSGARSPSDLLPESARGHATGE